jgi:uncharacterized protein
VGIDVLQILTLNLERIRSFGVNRIGAFGSMVNGNAGPDSDVDILVVFNEGEKTFDRYMDLKFHLEELFPGRKVDLVLESTLKPFLRPHIEKTVRYVA